MKQLVQSARTGRLALRDVPEPKVRPGHVLVRTRSSLISAGTERMVVAFARKSLVGKAQARPDLVRKVLEKVKRDGPVAAARAVWARLDEPLPLGYSAAGEVVAVGAGLEGGFRVGERVAVAGAGLANHAEVNVVPGNLAASVPSDVTDEEACFGTLIAIAMHAVRNTGAGLGDVVGVVGVGLVGQLASQLLALGGARVIAIDRSADRLALARRLGAEIALDPADLGLDAAVKSVTGGRGCDAVLIAAATDSSEPFATAARIARDRARVAVVGLTGTAFPYQDFMKKELSIVVSRSYGPGRYDRDYEERGIKYPEGWVRWTETENLKEGLRLMSPACPRRLDVKSLITHRFPADEANAAYDLITGAEPQLGVVLLYPEKPSKVIEAAFPAARTVAAGACVLGVIGAGAFARSALLPELKRMSRVTLDTLVTQRGTSAEHGREMFGFARASSDEKDVLENPRINAVLVATRHDSHADLAARALAAGKPVLVEKPLALTLQDINRVVEARNASAAFFQVGFNRRYAPLARALKERLLAIPGAKSLLLRVNAGALPADHWTRQPDSGGGRILGEVCHFVDLARFLVGDAIQSVHAESAAAETGSVEDVSIAIRFRDRSLATIIYTALGDPSFPKERIEAYAGGSAFALDDFRTLTSVEQGRTAVDKSSKDKGIAAALAAFVDAVISGGPPPVDEAELIETSAATVAVMESLRSGERVDL
ncbi:MAG: theronine dehydrogenase [Rhodospirillales bacterium]|nr:theronine dehydrogenase [Rhodospirillales bacterium]